MKKASRLDALVRARFELSWGKARAAIETGKVFVEGKVATDPSLELLDDAAIELRMNAPRPKTISSDQSALSNRNVVYVDTQVIVVRKPAGISTVPFEKNERGTLEDEVCGFLGQPRVVVVHRLDRETSGLVVFARNREAGAALANQFRFHSVLRRYYALAHGKVPSRTIRSLLVENRGDGLRGSIFPGSWISKADAKEAITHVQALAHFNGIALIECRLETGRTHQIRIHLSEAGHPLLGEKAYIREFAVTRIEAPRLMLHAAELGFMHPTRQELMHWIEPPPEDFLNLLPTDVRAKLIEATRSV